jgi:hypothetical protein
LGREKTGEKQAYIVKKYHLVTGGYNNYIGKPDIQGKPEKPCEGKNQACLQQNNHNCRKITYMVIYKLEHCD